MEFFVFDNDDQLSWHRYFYLGGMWTRDWNWPSGWVVKFSWKIKRVFERKIEKSWRREDDIGVVCCWCCGDHKNKMDAMRMKIRKIRKYVVTKEAWYHYAVGAIGTFIVAFKCFR